MDINERACSTSILAVVLGSIFSLLVGCPARSGDLYQERAFSEVISREENLLNKRSDLVGTVKELGGTVTVLLDPVEPESDMLFLDLSHNPNVHDSDLESLLDGKLISVDLTGTSITDAGLECFVGCDKILELNISNTGVSNLGLSHVSTITSLHTLNVASTMIDDECYVHFRKMQQLRHLDLSDNQIGDLLVEQLVDNVHLSVLVLSRTNVTDEICRSILIMDNLELVIVEETVVDSECLSSMAESDGLEVRASGPSATAENDGE